jgi:hypothetical protein
MTMMTPENCSICTIQAHELYVPLHDISQTSFWEWFAQHNHVEHLRHVEDAQVLKEIIDTAAATVRSWRSSPPKVQAEGWNVELFMGRMPDYEAYTCRITRISDDRRDSASTYMLIEDMEEAGPVGQVRLIGNTAMAMAKLLAS